MRALANPQGAAAAALLAVCREGASLLADVLDGAASHLRRAVQVALSAAVAAACVCGLVLPVALRCTRLVVAGLARWVWELASQAVWEHLASQLLTSTSPLPALLEANATTPETVPAILLGVVPSAEAAQMGGTIWTWSCLAMAVWRRSLGRR